MVKTPKQKMTVAVKEIFKTQQKISRDSGWVASRTKNEKVMAAKLAKFFEALKARGFQETPIPNTYRPEAFIGAFKLEDVTVLFTHIEKNFNGGLICNFWIKRPPKKAPPRPKNFVLYD